MKRIILAALVGEEKMNTPKAILIGFALVLLTTGVSSCSTSRSQIEIMQTDMTLMMAVIRGLRVGMSPRMVHKRLEGTGFAESKFSRVTLVDVIRQSDRKDSYVGYVILSAGERTTTSLDDESLSLSFCFGGLESIDLSQTILLSDYERYKKADIKMFPKAVPKIYENKQVMFSARYKPDKISSARISYVNRGHKNFLTNDPIIRRNVSILEQTRCHNKEMREIIRRYG